MGVALVLAVLSTFEIIKLDMVFIILGAALFGIIWGIATRKIKPEKKAAETEVTDAEKVEISEEVGAEPQTEVHEENTEEGGEE